MNNRKRTGYSLLVVLLLTVILAGCSNGVTEPGKASRNIRIIGTAVKSTASATKAITEGDTYVLDSVDSVMIDGVDIKSQLVPADPNAITEGADKQNNVVFEATVEVPEKITYEAEAKVGYVFDEWDVIEEDGKALTKEEEALLDEIEDYLEKHSLEHAEKITVPSRYISYLVPEYDNGFYIDLEATEDSAEHDGSQARMYTVSEFIKRGYEEEELTLVLAGKNLDNLQALIANLMENTKLEEVKIIANGIEIPNLPPIAIEELTVSGVTFSNGVEISVAKGEFKFEGCTFKGALNIENAKEIELRNCTMQDVIVTNVAEFEIKNGTAGNITVSTAEVEEVEMKNLTLSGKLDLSAIEKGEVELKKVKATEIIPPKTSDYEVK